MDWLLGYWRAADQAAQPDPFSAASAVASIPTHGNEPKPSQQFLTPAEMTDEDWSVVGVNARAERAPQPQQPRSVFSPSGDAAALPGGAYAGGYAGNPKTPYRGTDGSWHDGVTMLPLTPPQMAAWGVK
jgi:hypothetical protein